MPHNYSVSIALDDLVFTQARLGRFLEPLPPSPNIELGVLGGKRGLGIPSPWFLRQPLMSRLGSFWPPLCGLLRAHGIATFCPVEDFDKVSAAQAPVRFARRHTLQPLVVNELRTADAIELECYNPRTQCWVWPPELENPADLPAMLSTIRMAVGSTTPVGICLPLDIGDEALSTSLAAQPDFITLDGRAAIEGNHPAVLLDTLRRVRAAKAQTAAGGTAVLVVADVTESLHCLKLLALGATAVSIDSIVATWLTQARQPAIEPPAGMLSSIGFPSAPRIDLSPVEKGLIGLHAGLQQVLTRLGVVDLRGLTTDTLRGVSAAACQLSGTRQLA
jgi:hypothetical protein